MLHAVPGGLLPCQSPQLLNFFGAFPQGFMGFGGHGAQACIKAYPKEDAREGTPELRAVVGRAHSLWIFSFWKVASTRARRATREPRIQRSGEGLGNETVVLSA